MWCSKTSNLSVNTENKNVVWHSTMTEHILCLMNSYKEQDFEPITFLGGQGYHKLHLADIKFISAKCPVASWGLLGRKKEEKKPLHGRDTFYHLSSCHMVSG